MGGPSGEVESGGVERAPSAQLRAKSLRSKVGSSRGVPGPANGVAQLKEDDLEALACGPQYAGDPGLALEESCGGRLLLHLPAEARLPRRGARLPPSEEKSQLCSLLQGNPRSLGTGSWCLKEGEKTGSL